MKNTLAYHVFDESVEQHMANHEPDSTASMQMYLHNSRKLFSCFMSDKPLSSPNDAQLLEIKDVKDWFTGWKSGLRDLYPQGKEVSSRFISWQTFDDVCMTVDGLCALIEYIASEQFHVLHGPGYYIVPKRLNQNIIESHFSMRRAACGGSTNMTAVTYAYNNQRLILTRLATRNKQKYNGRLSKRKRAKDEQAIWEIF